MAAVMKGWSLVAGCELRKSSEEGAVVVARPARENYRLGVRLGVSGITRGRCV